MIDKSNSEPPQFGYIYLREGFYLNIDPIGWMFLTIARLIHRLKEKMLGKDERYYQNLAHWWDGFYRVKLRIPYWFMKLERKRFE